MVNCKKNKKVCFLEFLKVWSKEQGILLPEHHKRIAEWLESVYYSDKKRGLLLAFRSSGKSTVVGLFCSWLLYINPNIRILVIAADTVLAKKMVRNIKKIVETHPMLEEIKPKKKQEWASGSFTVERSLALRDPSVMAVGLLSNATGSRADVIICDDVEVPKNCDTYQKRCDLREKLLELNFILVPNGMQIFIGTPHTFDTIYKV
ncbi:phage terminase large subunit [bacterium]|nr:phage terminase large subunit [bacterium]